MSLYDPIVERTLNQAAARWKALASVQHASTVGAALLVALLLLGLGKVAGWVSASVVLILGMLLIWVGLLGLLVLLGIINGSRKPRARLARELERAHRPLLDRLNTLVHLEDQPETAVADSYGRRIKDQTHGVLERRTVPRPFSATRPLIHLSVFLFLLAATIAFSIQYEPWRLPVVQTPVPPPAEPTLELPPPIAMATEEPWGEVRITRPGADLAVTRAEDVPIQIEAAANRPLKSIEWVTAVNGGDEQTHPLPPPQEPLFSASQTTLRPVDLKMQEWDVVAYHARATTETGVAYRSEIYFLEIRPFQEDLKQLPDGDAGPVYDWLNELTGLIEQQQEVIRRTQREQETQDGKPALPKASRDELARTEGEIARATEHLSAQLAAVAGPETGDSRDRLSEAKTDLNQAADNLRDDALDDAQRTQRAALAQLVKARKLVQKAAADNPDAFRLKDEKRAQAPAPEEMLKRIAEFRDESKAAREFVKQTLEQQNQIAKEAGAPSARARPQLADKQDALRKALDDFRKQHPKPFEDAAQPCDAACQSMSQTAQALKATPANSANASAAAEQAAKNLQTLSDELEQDAHAQQLADAYRLKQMLDSHIDQFRKLEADPKTLSQKQLEKEIEDACQTARELKKLAEQAPTRDDFGQELRDALKDEHISELESQCQGTAQGKGKGAGGVKQELEKMAHAFEKGQPKALAEGNGSGGLKPGAQGALDRGLEQLEALARGEEGKSGDDGKQRRETFANLEAGIFGRFGHNERTTAIVRRLDRELREKSEPIDPRVIAKLRDELIDRRVEVSGGDGPKPDAPKATHLDPARLPPAYRKAIETYFERLSERP